MPGRVKGAWVNHSKEEVEEAFKSDFSKPKVYASNPITKNIKLRNEERAVRKDDLNVVKECFECQKKIKKIKKPFYVPARKSFSVVMTANKHQSMSVTAETFGNFLYKILHQSQRKIQRKHMQEFLKNMKVKVWKK